jgi:NAD(P)-dependent dehydrogenase (short-subunit alcohol dehydrogenase family)
MGCRFEGQVAVVTGAASGLGEGIVKRLAREGATVALFDRDSDALERTVASFRNLKLRASGYAVDVSTEVAVQSAFETVRDEVGSPKIMVNCSGIVGPTNTPHPLLPQRRPRASLQCEPPWLLLDDQLNPASYVEGMLWPYYADSIHFRKRRKSLQVRIHFFQSGRDWLVKGAAKEISEKRRDD